jgi:hypothetical protein
MHQASAASYDLPDPSTLHWFPVDMAVLPLLLLAPVAAFGSVILAVFGWRKGRSDCYVCLITLASFGVLIRLLVDLSAAMWIPNGERPGEGCGPVRGDLTTSRVSAHLSADCP